MGGRRGEYLESPGLSSLPGCQLVLAGDGGLTASVPARHTDYLLSVSNGSATNCKINHDQITSTHDGS